MTILLERGAGDPDRIATPYRILRPSPLDEIVERGRRRTQALGAAPCTSNVSMTSIGGRRPRVAAPTR